MDSALSRFKKFIDDHKIIDDSELLCIATSAKFKRFESDILVHKTDPPTSAERVWKNIENLLRTLSKDLQDALAFGDNPLEIDPFGTIQFELRDVDSNFEKIWSAVAKTEPVYHILSRIDQGLTNKYDKIVQTRAIVLTALLRYDTKDPNSGSIHASASDISPAEECSLKFLLETPEIDETSFRNWSSDELKRIVIQLARSHVHRLVFHFSMQGPGLKVVSDAEWNMHYDKIQNCRRQLFSVQQEERRECHTRISKIQERFSAMRSSYKSDGVLQKMFQKVQDLFDAFLRQDNSPTDQAIEDCLETLQLFIASRLPGDQTTVYTQFFEVVEDCLVQVNNLTVKFEIFARADQTCGDWDPQAILWKPAKSAMDKAVSSRVKEEIDQDSTNESIRERLGELEFRDAWTYKKAFYFLQRLCEEADTQFVDVKLPCTLEGIEKALALFARHEIFERYSTIMSAT